MSVGLTALLFGLTVFTVMYAIWAPISELPPDTVGDDFEVSVAVPDHSGLFERIVRPAVRNFLPQTPMAAQMKARNSSKIQELLVRSGNPWNIQPEEYFGLRVLAAVLGFFVGLAMVYLDLLPMLLFKEEWIFIGAAIGYWIPKTLLDKEKGKRLKDARKGLPEALDLLVITLNSGQNFSPALSEVVSRLPEGVIRDELTRVAADLRSGKNLTRSLTDFARRAPSDEVEGFCKAVITSERLGADVSETLKSQSASARQAYEAALDARIGKLPTTLFFPILGLMLPALFVSILAPALSSIGQAL